MLGLKCSKRFDTDWWWKFIFSCILLMVAANAFDRGLGELEGRLFPVKDHAAITDFDFNGESTRISGTAERHRECKLRRIEWYYGSPDGESTRVDVVRRKRPYFIEEGSYVFANWEIFLTPDEVRNNSYAFAVHTCHILFDTVTLFYNAHDKGV